MIQKKQLNMMLQLMTTMMMVAMKMTMIMTVDRSFSINYYCGSSLRHQTPEQHY